MRLEALPLDSALNTFQSLFSLPVLERGTRFRTSVCILKARQRRTILVHAAVCNMHISSVPRELLRQNGKAAALFLRALQIGTVQVPCIYRGRDFGVHFDH